MPTPRPAEDALDRAADRIWDEIQKLLEGGQPDLERIAVLRERARSLRDLARREEHDARLRAALHDET